MNTHIIVERFGQTKSPLNISVVTETFPPDINGVAHTLSKMVNGLQLNGHNIWLVRPRIEKKELAQNRQGFNELLVKGMPIPFYKQLRMGLPAKKELHRLWSHKRPDVVHIATEGPLGWSALQVAKKLKIPISTDFRTNFHAYSSHYGIGWLSGAILSYMRKFHNAADATMVPTEQLAQTLSSAGFERLHVVPRGIDTQLFSPSKRDPALRASWKADSDTIVMLYVGRLAVEKNLELVLQTYAMAKQQSVKAKLVLVGDGPMRHELEQSFADVIFAGFRTGEDLAAHYASADMFVFASQTETFGNVTLEAMASGLAVVAFNHAAAGELIQNGVNGMLAAHASDIHFEMAAQTLLNRPELMAYVRQQACISAQSMGWDTIVKKTETVIYDVLDQREFFSAARTTIASPLSLV
ncbi:MAG: glycosyltransferase family 1 protein [Betaproteobacteria bacterium]|nr:glycosyltransferase family 1 protein [Betaproteobacteria bacterium]